MTNDEAQGMYHAGIARALRDRDKPPKPAILVAPPADERDAVRLIVDAIATEIIDPAALYAGLRPVLARLARDGARGVTDDPHVTPLGYAYASELLDAARTLERADARRTWARWREIRRMPGIGVVNGRPIYRFVEGGARAPIWGQIFAGMRDAWRTFRGA